MAKKRRPTNRRRPNPPRISSPTPAERLKLGSAQVLWDAGQHQEAVRELVEMLRLDPKDNAGIRYTLAARLLFLDRNDDLARLLSRYEDDNSTSWTYNQALLAFRQQGDTIDARRLLKTARKTNKYVIDYLLGREMIPSEMPPFSSADVRDAGMYAAETLVSWKSTDGAIAWLRAQSRPKKPVAAIPKGPLGVIKKWLISHLPQQDDVWQAKLCMLPNWTSIAGEFVRLSTFLVTNRTDDRVLAHQLLDESPSSALVWDILVQAMQHPPIGNPHRPGEIQVKSGELWDALRPHIEELGIRLVVSEKLDQLEFVFNDMCEHVCGPARPGLVDIPDVTGEQVGRFYEAAATYFRRAPWKKVGDFQAIEIKSDRLAGSPRYAVVMGQGGMTTGLALYEDLESLQRLWRTSANEEAAAQTVATSVIFGEEWTIAVADLEASRRYGWPVARPDAYPDVLSSDRGELRQPPVAELEILEACMRAIPDFVDRQPRDNPSPIVREVALASGPLTMTLSWVNE